MPFFHAAISFCSLQRSLIWPAQGTLRQSVQQLQQGCILMSMSPLGLSLNLDVTLSLILSVRKDGRYCLWNPMVKGEWQGAQLILAVPPSASQPEKSWAGQELPMVQGQEATDAKFSTSVGLPTPGFSPLQTPEKKTNATMLATQCHRTVEVGRGPWTSCLRLILSSSMVT